MVTEPSLWVFLRITTILFRFFEDEEETYEGLASEKLNFDYKFYEAFEVKFIFFKNF